MYCLLLKIGGVLFTSNDSEVIMKTVYLTAGPRGAGKSTYVSKIQEYHSEVQVVDRDRLFEAEFGMTGFDPYSGMHLVAETVLNERIKDVIRSADDEAKIIIDSWNGFPDTRLKFIRQFRELAVERVVCWYFVTPLAVCLEWFKQKPGLTGLSDRCCTWDFNLYHEQASDINYPDHDVYQPDTEYDNTRFDLICRINPLQLTLPNVPLI
ncbi:MAG: AAA family ATPase [bacterium]